MKLHFIIKVTAETKAEYYGDDDPVKIEHENIEEVGVPEYIRTLMDQEGVFPEVEITVEK